MRKPIPWISVSPAVASYLTCRSSLADPRLSTSISRQQLRKSRNTAESRSGFCSSGVPFVAIKYSAWRQRKQKIVLFIPRNAHTDPTFKFQSSLAVSSLAEGWRWLSYINNKNPTKNPKNPWCSHSYSNIKMILPWQLISLADLVSRNYISTFCFSKYWHSFTGHFKESVWSKYIISKDYYIKCISAVLTGP